MTQQEPEEYPFHILRGRRIEEFKADELIALHQQINDELPEANGLESTDPPQYQRLLELELIEDELERRHEKFQ